MHTIHDTSLAPIEFDLAGCAVDLIRKHLPNGGNVNQQPIDFEAARRERDAGMDRAHQHAERLDMDWPDTAYAFLVRYARANAELEGWQVTNEAKRLGYASPADDRAWGSVYRRAMKEGVIEVCGVGRNPNRHASICPRYRSLIFVGYAA